MKPSYTKRDKVVTREIHKLFWQAMLEHRVSFAAAALFHSPFYFFVNILIPLQTAYGLQAIINRQFDQVSQHALLVVIFSLFGCIFYWIASLGINRNGILGAAYVQRKVFGNYLSKDYDFYSSTYIGSLGTQAANLREACDSYNLIFLADIPKVVVITVFSLLVIALHAPLLALVTILAMLFTLSVTIFFSFYRLRYRRIVSQTSSQLSGVLGDALSHAPAVKSFSQEAYERERLSKPLKTWQTAQLKSWDLSIPANALRYIFLAATTATLLLVSSRLYQEGTLSIAIITLVQLYVIRLLTVTLEIGDIIKRYEGIMSSAYQPVASMLVPTDITDLLQPQRLDTQNGCAIVFSDVTYRYPEAATKNVAIDNFSLDIKPGEKIGLVGYSGGGKTTITKLLMRFMDVDSGSISINGIPITAVRQTELRSSIAYVPQEPVLFHRTIAENISYGKPHATESEITAVARAAFVEDFVSSLPNGYDTTVGERGIKLSGGQRQRVAIARALLINAPILVLDEATSALDSDSEQYIQKALWQLMKDRTAIVVAHRLSTIQKMDRIAVLEKGKIRQIGTHRQLLKDRHGPYAKLWAHQSDGYIVES